MKKIFVLMALSAFSLVSADKFMTRGNDCCSQWDDGFAGYQGFSDQPQWGSEPYSNYQPQPAGFQPQFEAQNQGYDVRNMQWGGPGFQRVGDRFQISDQELAKKVHDALNSGKAYQELVFRVDNGIVTVRGPVESMDYKSKAEDAIKKIDGVRNVNSQIALMVGRSGPGNDTRVAEKTDPKFVNDFAATEGDKEVNAKIRDKLSGGWFSKGYEAIVLRTNNGIVIITGTVDSQDDANKINEHLKGIEGIRKVNVQVAVKKK